ncbi:MAG: SDR family NAD(P)-dependent oxidoreductase [Streptosporangiaceae bacterium]
MLDALGRPARILLLGGTSEIGLAILTALRAPRETEVLLAGRDEQALAAAGKTMPYQVRTLAFDALDFDSHQGVIDATFEDGEVDLVISAAGVLVRQDTLAGDPLQAGRLVGANFTGHVTTLLAVSARLRAQGHGTIVILSSIAAVRPRKANLVYGAAKAGLDAFGRGLTDALHGTGVRVLLVRPGFVIGRMTEGMSPAPLATTPSAVGEAVAGALARNETLVWVPGTLRVLAAALRLVPRPAWRKIRR